MICSHILYGHFSSPVKGVTSLPQYSQTLRYIPPQSTARPGSLSGPQLSLSHGDETPKGLFVPPVRRAAPCLTDQRELPCTARKPLFSAQTQLLSFSPGRRLLPLASPAVSTVPGRPASVGWQNQSCRTARWSLPGSWEGRSSRGGRGQHGPGVESRQESVQQRLRRATWPLLGVVVKGKEEMGTGMCGLCLAGSRSRDHAEQ